MTTQHNKQTNLVTDEASWKNLLRYYRRCLIEEHRSNYVIERDSVSSLCRFLPGISGDFLRNEERLFLEIRGLSWREQKDLREFVVDKPQRQGAFLSVSFGYPFFVDADSNVIPLLYVIVSGEDIEGGVRLKQVSTEVEVNYAALWQVLPETEREGWASPEDIFQLFDQLDEVSGQSRFDGMLSLLIEQIEILAQARLNHVQAEEFKPQPAALSPLTVVHCPVLFHVRNLYTYHLLGEIDRLIQNHGWDEVPQALRYLLTRTPEEPYPEAPNPGEDRRIYVMPVNDRQRQAIVAASRCPVTVVTGPPGTGKSQLIVNIVGDAILRGETVLIASRNNRAVDVVHQRFLGQVNYPGTVRTGKKEYREQLPHAMRPALSDVERGITDVKVDRIQQEYLDLLEQIRKHEQLIAKIKDLQRDRDLYRTELEELLDSLEGSLARSIRRVTLPLDDQQIERLGTLLRSLEEKTSALNERWQEIDDGVREFASKATEILEARRDSCFTFLHPPERIGCPQDMVNYLSSWDTLVSAISITWTKPYVQSRYEEAQSAFAALSGFLPPELVEELDSTLLHIDAGKVASLRAALQEERTEATEQLAGDLQKLVETLSYLVSRYSAPRCFLNLWTEPGEAALTAETADLRGIQRFFAFKEKILETHQVGIRRAHLRRQLTALEREKATNIAELDGLVESIEENLSAVRARISTLLLLRMDEIDPEDLVEDRVRWKRIAEQMLGLSQWAARVQEGKLSTIERLKQAILPRWASHRIRRAWSRLSTELGPLRVEEPEPDATFEEWATAIRDAAWFIQGCYLLAERQITLQHRTEYRESVERRMEEAKTQLEETESLFPNLIAGLPDAIARVMASEAWAYEHLETALVYGLVAAEESVISTLATYTAAVERVLSIQREYNLPKCLQEMTQTLVLEHGKGTGNSDTSSLYRLKNIIATSLQFCDAVEALAHLRDRQGDLSDLERALEEYLGLLPADVREEVVVAAMQVGEEWLQSTREELEILKAAVERWVEEWQQAQQQAIHSLQQNRLAIPVLAKAIERARKDPEYLKRLINHRNWAWPRDLLRDLHLWKQVIRAWAIQAELSKISGMLGNLPSLKEAQEKKDNLWAQRIRCAGKLLTEKWLQTAADLDIGTLDRVHRYANELSNGPSGGRRRRIAASYFDAVLRMFPVWSTTNLSTQDLPLQAGLFDIVVIDEASQCDIPSALPLLFRGKRLVIIGDHKQLTHIATLPDRTHRELVRQYGVDLSYQYPKTSLFDLASHSVAKVPGHITLNEHYRSCREIIQFSNETFYKSSLKVLTDLSGLPRVYQEYASGLFWLDVKGKAERPRSRVVYNLVEARVVAELVKEVYRYLERIDFMETNGREVEIGIVTPFRAQAEEIGKALRKSGVPRDRVMVGTVHTYQGNERDIMIFSTVVTADLPEHTANFMLLSRNLLNVAVTRARWTLLVVGDHEFFLRQPMRSPYQAFAAYAKERQRVYLDLDSLPFLRSVEEQESLLDLGEGIQLRPEAPYLSRMVLRRFLASCREYIWWYDPYMSIHALDAIATALDGTQPQVREIRLLTSKMFWENRKEPTCLTRDAVRPLKKQLQNLGIRLQVAITHWDEKNPPPHDRFLLSADRAVNMPPIKNIYATVRLAEFLPSTIEPRDFENWWRQAEIVYQ